MAKNGFRMKPFFSTENKQKLMELTSILLAITFLILIFKHVAMNREISYSEVNKS